MVLLAFALCAPLAAWAHHSVAYYSNEKIELEGEITKIEWQNPHIRFELRAVDSDGAEKTWRLEAARSSCARRTA